MGTGLSTVFTRPEASSLPRAWGRGLRLGIVDYGPGRFRARVGTGMNALDWDLPQESLPRTRGDGGPIPDSPAAFAHAWGRGVPAGGHELTSGCLRAHGDGVVSTSRSCWLVVASAHAWGRDGAGA